MGKDEGKLNLVIYQLSRSYKISLTKIMTKARILLSKSSVLERRRGDAGGGGQGGGGPREVVRCEHKHTITGFSFNTDCTAHGCATNVVQKFWLDPGCAEGVLESHPREDLVLV